MQHQEEEEVDKIESDNSMDSNKADTKVGERVLRRSINFTKFWKKKNEKKENKNVWEDNEILFSSKAKTNGF